MRKTVTKGLSALLALALALTLLCTGALAEGSATYPLFDEPVTITSVVKGVDMTHDRSLWTELGKLCGINFEFTNVENDQFPVYLSASAWPDFFNTGMGSSYMNDYGVLGGKFVDYATLLEYMPYLQEVLAEFPNARKAVTYSDGGMYQLPLIDVTCTSGNGTNRMHYRTDLLAEYGLEAPTTTEEFYQACKTAFEKTGTAPMISISKGFFYSALGTEVNWDFADDGTGKVVWNSCGEQYKRYIEYMHRMYAEGLLHKEYLTLDSTARNALCADGVLFMGGDGTQMTAADFPSGHFDIDQLAPLTSEWDDTKTYISNGSQMGSVSGFAINKDCQYAKELAQCFDILYAKEEVAPGTGLYCAAGHYGPEGHHWKFSNEEKTEFTFIYDDNPDNEPGNTYTYKRDIFGYGPFLYTFKNVVNSEESNTRSRQIGYINNLNPYVIPSFPSLTFNDDEQMTIDSYYADIKTYVSRMEAEFITGVTDIETGWDAYCEKVKAMGIDEVLGAYQSAYDRWNQL